MKNHIKSLISNGSYKFHLAPLASELSKQNLLAGLIVAGWPSVSQQRLINILPHSKALQRYLDRWEPVQEKLVFASPLTELILKVGDFGRKYSHVFQHIVHRSALACYASHASRVVRNLHPSIYHYRCGYGGSSVNHASCLNIPTICDHSIAHPYTAEFIVDNRGQLPASANDLRPKSILSELFAADINRSDYLLVNSKFVRETCILAGYPASRIFVVYLGIDDKYKATLTESRQQNDLPINRSLLYVGGWQRRKGVETLVDALNSLSPSINIEIAGGIEPDLRNSIKHCKFFAQSTTTYHGIIPRNQLSALFSKHTIFVFPSYCEGSARVIFEAMAAGCYIITTPNSGSIVEDGIHGAIVSPGDSLSLQKAIQFALDNPALVAAIGAENSHIVRNQYSQLDYMQNVLRVYHRILGR